jgi:hypothetical protein
MESLRMRHLLFLFAGRQSVPKLCNSYAVGSMMGRSCEKFLVYLNVFSGHGNVAYKCIHACCYVEILYY